MTTNLRPWLLSVLSFAIVAGAAGADPTPDTKDAPRDPKALTAAIDRLVAAQLAANEHKPQSRASDAEFMRRVYLDLIGKIPSVTEARDFLDDQRPDKRERLVDLLLRNRRYVDHFTNVWRSWWLPQMIADFEDPTPRLSFEAWLRNRLTANTPYDQMVREILVLRTPAAQGGRRRLGGEDVLTMDGSTPIAFYQANENKPENLAASTSRLFMGTKLECAQCHNHPFATWSREQFWQYAAFFAGVESGRAPKQITIPMTTTVVQARFLDNSTPEWKPNVNPRVTLADWLTAPDNKFFARAAVNRLWSYFFGSGMMEPVDDLREEGIWKESLEDLAKQFAAQKYDLKTLIRAIVLSEAYQRTSRMAPAAKPKKAPEDEDVEEPELFVRMSVKGLSPEQLFDSLVEATGYQAVARGAGNVQQLRAEFVARFNNQVEKRTDVQTSILQALALMNGKLIADATSLDRSRTLASVAEAPFLDTEGKIDALYLAALSRPSRPEERTRLAAYVNKGGPSGDQKQALADVFWALLNSSEFIFNH